MRLGYIPRFLTYMAAVEGAAGLKNDVGGDALSKGSQDACRYQSRHTSSQSELLKAVEVNRSLWGCLFGVSGFGREEE
jgi:hypothetical protein